MILAYNGITPPKEWYHNPELQNKDGKTVEIYLMEKNIFVPDMWNYTEK